MSSHEARAFMESLYSAAAHAGFLVECCWENDDGYDAYAMVSFREHDQSLLNGLASSREPTITYPRSAMPTLTKAALVTIEGKIYRVREVTVIADGTEARAMLTFIEED